LVLKFTGKQVDETLLNTIRRVALNDIPMYAFAPECIEIEKNTTIYNNDQIRVRFSQLPIFDTVVLTDYLEDVYWRDVDYAVRDRPKHPAEKRISIYIDHTNQTTTPAYVTTNDIQYIENDEKRPAKYNQKYPIALLKLKPGETLICKLDAVLGVGVRNAIWASAGNAYYTYTKGEGIFYIESQGQFDEYTILIKCCHYLQQKLTSLQKTINDKYKDVSDNVPGLELVLDNESHTIGGIMASIIQDHPDVMYAGVGKPNFLSDQIVIKIKYIKPTKQPLSVVNDAITYIIKMFAHIESLIVKP
jgi:DNA-directed RNA polymerase subunit L